MPDDVETQVLPLWQVLASRLATFWKHNVSGVRSRHRDTGSCRNLLFCHLVEGASIRRRTPGINMILALRTTDSEVRRTNEICSAAVDKATVRLTSISVRQRKGSGPRMTAWFNKGNARRHEIQVLLSSL